MIVSMKAHADEIIILTHKFLYNQIEIDVLALLYILYYLRTANITYEMIHILHVFEFFGIGGVFFSRNQI